MAAALWAIGALKFDANKRPTYDVQFDSEMAGWRVFEIDSTTIDAFVLERDVGNWQLALAWCVALHGETEIGPSSERGNFGPAAPQTQRLSANIKPAKKGGTRILSVSNEINGKLAIGGH